MPKKIFKVLFKRKTLTPQEELKKLKRDNIRYQIDIIIIFLILLALFFFNYNYTVFKILIAGNYINTDALDSIYSRHIAFESGSSYLKAFDNVVISVFTDELRKESKDNYTVFFNRGELSREQNSIETDGKMTSFKKLDDNTGILTLTAFSSSSGKAVKDELGRMRDCKNLIIDLRDNGGGVLKYANRISEYFLPAGNTISIYNYRSKLFSSAPKSKNKTPLHPDKIYILQNNMTASAAEVFINALRENLDNVTVIGGYSYGKGIGQTEIKLLDGYGVKATTLNILTPKGNTIHGTGIKPDITPDRDELEYTLEHIDKNR